MRAHGNARLTWREVKEIRKIGHKVSARIIADELQISKRAVLDILSNKTWRYEGQWDRVRDARETSEYLY